MSCNIKHPEKDKFTCQLPKGHTGKHYCIIHYKNPNGYENCSWHESDRKQPSFFELISNKQENTMGAT